MIAITHRAHHDTAAMIAPVGSSHSLARVIVGDRLADEAADRRVVEYRRFLAQHIDDGSVAEAMLVLGINLSTSVGVMPNARSLRTHSHIAVAGATRCVEGEAVCYIHPARICGLDGGDYRRQDAVLSCLSTFQLSRQCLYFIRRNDAEAKAAATQMID